jgi:hypothetical protein
MSLGGSEYTLNIKLNVTNLKQVQDEIAALGRGGGGGGGGSGGGGGAPGGGSSAGGVGPGGMNEGGGGRRRSSRSGGGGGLEAFVQPNTRPHLPSDVNGGGSASGAISYKSNAQMLEVMVSGDRNMANNRDDKYQFAFDSQNALKPQLFSAGAEMSNLMASGEMNREANRLANQRYKNDVWAQEAKARLRGDHLDPNGFGAFSRSLDGLNTPHSPKKPGKGGGSGGQGGGFMGAPNPMGIYFAATFGAYEVGAAVTGVSQGMSNAAIAPDRVSRMQAELQGATAGFGGVLGSTAGLVMDAMGIGPASITRSMTSSIASIQSGYAAADSRISLGGARAGYAAGSGRFASERANRADIAANTSFALTQRSSSDNIKELEGRLSQDDMNAGYNADKMSGKTTSFFEEYSGNLSLKPRLDQTERDTINNRLADERNRAEIARISRDEAIRQSKEDRSLALFGNQQIGAQSAANAFAQGSSFSSTEAYRMSRQVQRNDLMYGRNLSEPGVAEMIGSFNSETNAVSRRMDQVRNTEISQLMRTEMMTTDVSNVGRGRSTYSSRKEEIEGRFDIEMEGISLVTSPDVRAAREGVARANRKAALRANDTAFDDAISDISRGQRTSSRQISAFEGRYAYAAGALGISGAAVQTATELRRQEMYGPANNELLLAQRKIGLERRNYLEAFRGEQFDARNIGISSRDQENVGATLKGISDAMDEVITAIKELVSN